MNQTPNLDLPYLAAAQAQKRVTVNESLRRLDAIVQIGVASRTQVAPPTAPIDGERHIVPTSAIGDWAGHGHAVAAYQDGAWACYTPTVGWLAWITDEAALVVWDATAWTETSGASALNPTPLLGVNAIADTTKRLAVASPISLFNHVGAGYQAILNKASTADTASVVFQTGFSGRADVGLTGDDDWRVKVSANSSDWTEALVADHATGLVRFPANEAWSTYTPAVSAGAGSLGANPPTATGAYCDVGSIRFFDILVTFPSNYSAGGPTASGFIGVGVPSAPVANMDNGMGREVALVGSMLACFGFVGSTTVRAVRLVDLGFVAGDSYQLHLQFHFRTA